MDTKNSLDQKPADSIPQADNHEQVHPGKLPAGAIVWQWVSYGLWEWSLIALAALLSIIFAYYFVSSADNPFTGADYITYPMAALICLMPIAFIVNHYFEKTEPAKKEGFAAVVMVLNAVAVLLATVGGLVVTVVSSLSSLANGPSADGNITIATAAVVTVLGAMLFIRIIQPQRLAKFQKAFPYVVVIVAFIAVGAAAGGPFRSYVTSRSDRLIENNLQTLSQDIDDYYNNDNRLPADLGAIDYSSESDTGPDSGQALYQQNLVQYEVINSAAGTYNLCVNYTHVLGSGTASNDPTTIDTSSHPQGRVCYYQNTGSGSSVLPGGIYNNASPAPAQNTSKS
jgi:type II secretory pathway pseudopilin PulG